MTLPFAPKYALLGGLGVAGTPALAYGGWYIYDESNPTSHKALARKGYSWNPLPQQLKDPKLPVLDGTKHLDPAFKFEAGECFKRFFPGAEVKFGDRVVKEAHTQYSVSSPASSRSSAIGCSTMSLFSGKDETKFAFMSETTVKNDRVGMAIWAGAKNARFSNVTLVPGSFAAKSLRLHYVVIFLEKDKNGWTVKGGIQWRDQASVYAGGELKIISPDQKLNKKYKEAADDDVVENTTPAHYVGIWEQNPQEEGEEVFREICVAFRPWPASAHPNDEPGCKSVDPEILGGTGYFSSTNTSSALGIRGYASVDYVYDIDGRQWIYKVTSPHKDFTATLHTWYAPFKNKKGKWRTDVADYCNSISGGRNADEKTLYLLEGFCYMHNSPSR